MMNNFILGEIPKTRSYQFADLAEILLLVGDADEISHADLSGVINQGIPDPDPDDAPDIDAHAVDINGREQGYIKSCFNHFSYRASAFGDTYPFELDDEILVKKPNITEQNYVYLFLLVCSRLAAFSNLSFRQYCAHLFVDVSAHALKNLMSGNSKIWVFDANSKDRKSIEFSTNLREALRKLGVKISERHDEEVVMQQSTSGDAGLDLVGVHQFHDRARGALTFFGQCAAQQNDWPKKTFEPKKLKTLFNFSHEPYNLNFIPVLYRQINGSWVNEMPTSDCLIVDRLRIAKSIYQNNEALPNELFTQIKSCVDTLSKDNKKLAA